MKKTSAMLIMEVKASDFDAHLRHTLDNLQDDDCTIVDIKYSINPNVGTYTYTALIIYTYEEE